MTRFLPTLAIAGFVTLSCSRDSAPTAPTPIPQFDGEHTTGTRESTRHTASLVLCRPLPYAADTQVIGPAGGTLHIGPHVLRFPAGALSSPVKIVGEAPRDTIRSVKLYPQGLQFDDAWLTLSYNGCQDRPGRHAHRVAYTDDAGTVLYYVESYDQPGSKRVSGEIGHFSRYAVGW